ncbi:MAG: tetratricopeptide repeat protein, partial [bacterium]|nr:tetratricopeptide repeat protein [bacterium]
MSDNQKRLLRAVAIALVLGAGAYYGISTLAAPHSSGDAATHPPITEMDGEFSDPEALAQALQKNPTHIPILLRMGQLSLESGDAENAVHHLEEAVNLDPHNLDARLELGRALYQTGDAERAIQETEKILETEPNHVDALYNLGAIHANRNDPEQAREYWGRAVAAGPNTPSGANARRGLDVLNGRAPDSIPDIPE